MIDAKHCGTDTQLPTTVDAVLGGRLRLEQPVKGPRVGLDAVFLAQAIPILSGSVVDVGAGTGVVGLAVAQKAAGVVLTAIELDAGLAAMIGRNALSNGLEHQVRVVHGDVLAPLRELGLEPSSQDYVLCNPPFATTGEGRVAASPVRQRAHVMAAGDLEHWARRWSALARADGQLAIVHRADRIGEILAALDARFGAIEIMPLFPRVGVAAHRVLVRGIKGSRALPTLHAGMVLHDANGDWTPAVQAVLTAEATVWKR
jgi:tRNA1(Val) A37 N6-methylase TrmN6